MFRVLARNVTGMYQNVVAVSCRVAVGACLLTIAASCGAGLVEDSDGSRPAPEPVETRPSESAPVVASLVPTDPGEPAPAGTSADASTGSVVTLPVEEGSLQTRAPDVDEDVLAGDAIGFGPEPGDRLVVAAVESDDVLNVRDEPMGAVVAMLEMVRGETEERLRVLRPDSSVAAYLEDDAVVSTGRARSLPRSTWYEVAVGGYTGWASAAYLAYPATVEDVTDEVARAAGGLPEAAGMDELARIVLEALEPRVSGVPVIVSGPGWFEGLAEMEIDLVVRGSRHFGQRLYIAADADLDWDDTLEVVDARLRSVSLRTLCSRGWDSERCL